jgi:inorganic pyrophosphatase
MMTCRVVRDRAVRSCVKDYKTPDGKPINKFGLDDKCMDKAYTMGIIEETSGFYQKLMSGERENDKGLSLK